MHATKRNKCTKDINANSCVSNPNSITTANTTAVIVLVMSTDLSKPIRHFFALQENREKAQPLQVMFALLN